MLSFTVLATAWALFSGPTHYISLATVAFFGIGAYTAAVFGEPVPWPLVLFIASAGAGLAVALVVGLSTLRLSGVYFVIFTFGLAELIRQLVTWYEVNVTGHDRALPVPRHARSDAIYWQLLALTAASFADRLADRPLAPRPRRAGDRRRRGGRPGTAASTPRAPRSLLFALSCRLHDADRRDHGAALDLHRPRHRLQSDDLVPGRDHGAAGRRRRPVRAGAGRDPAGAAVRGAHRQLPERVQHPARRSSSSSSSTAVPHGVIGLLAAVALARAVRRLRVPASRGRDQLLAVDGLRKSFGGLRAVDEVSLPRRARRDRRPDRPERLGQDDRAQPDLRRPPARHRRHPLSAASRSTAPQPTGSPWVGIARTFQLVRVLPSMSLRRERRRRPAFRASGHRHAATRRRHRACLAARRPGSTCAGTSRRRAHLHRPEAAGAGSRAGAGAEAAAARRVAGRPEPDRAGGRHLAHPIAARATASRSFMVEHVMDAIRALCDRCVVMSAGRLIAAGRRRTTCCAEPEVVRAYLGRRPMLEISDLSVSLRQAPGAVRRRPQRRRGEIVAMLGANGAGKITLLKADRRSSWSRRRRVGSRSATIDLSALAAASRSSRPASALVPEGRGIFARSHRAREPAARRLSGPRPRWRERDARDACSPSSRAWTERLPQAVGTMSRRRAADGGHRRAR